MRALYLLPGGRRWRSGSSTWNVVPAPGSLSNRDRAAVGLDDRLRDRRARGPCPGWRCSSRSLSGRSAGTAAPARRPGSRSPVSRHLEDDASPPCACARTSTRPPGRRELDGVRDEVVERAARAARGRRRRRGALDVGVERERRLPSARRAGGSLDGLRRELRRGRPRSRSSASRPASTWATNSRSPTRPSSRLRVAVDDLEEARAARRVSSPSSLVEQQLEVADDRGQRRAQLVRDRARRTRPSGGRPARSAVVSRSTNMRPLGVPVESRTGPT